MDNITQSEYNRIMDEHEELVELILDRTKELANILHNRDPIGKCHETDFDINADGSLLIQFENYYDCDDCDSYHLPLEFIFNEEYRKNYKTSILLFRIDDERKRMEAKDAKLERDRKQMENYDKAEYERLRKKYGD
jgi:hypothetical protein